VRARSRPAEGRSTRTTSSRSVLTSKSSTICPVSGSNAPSWLRTTTRSPSETMRSSCKGRVTFGSERRSAATARVTSRKRTLCCNRDWAVRSAIRSENVYARRPRRRAVGETTPARSNVRRRAGVMESRREISPHEKRSVSGSRLPSVGGLPPRAAPSSRCCMRPPPGPNTTWMIFSSRCFLRPMVLVIRDVMYHSAHDAPLSRGGALNREPVSASVESS
jgi:hypothetical protein